MSQKEQNTTTGSNIINTGGAQDGDQNQIATQKELKDLYSEIQRNMDKNLELAASIEQFRNLISALNRRYLANEGAEKKPAATEEAADGESAAAGEVKKDETNKYLYEDLIPGTASRLVRHGKSNNQVFTALIGDTLTELAELLATELRLQTPTCYQMIEACRPVFDLAQPYYYHHHQKVMPMAYGGTNQAGGAGGAKADLTPFSKEDIDWRNSLVEKDVVDVVKHDMSLSIEGWSRGEIQIISGSDNNTTNLGDGNADKIKRFSINYFKDAAAGSKVFRADSLQIAPYDTKTSGDEWRYNSKVGDTVDFMDNYGNWSTCTIIKKDSELNNPLPMVTIGFRRYSPMGDQTDSMGKYFGKDEHFDEQIGLYSIRVQQAHTCANNADPENKIVWKFKPMQSPTTTQTPTDNSAAQGQTQMIATTTDGAADSQSSQTTADSTAASTAGQASGATTNQANKAKTPDERDMEMITEERPKIWAVERYSCKSSFLVKLMNQFGAANGYESLFNLIGMANQSVERIDSMVHFFVKSQAMFHKQFVDDMYSKLSNAVESRLLSLTSDELKSIKLEMIQEIITQIWHNLLLRKIQFQDLQVLKAHLQVKVGILFMKQTFFKNRIEGAKLIEIVCNKAIQDVSAVQSVSNAAAQAKFNLLQELVDILKEANVLDLFFGSKNIHNQLVQRSGGMLKLMIKKQVLTNQELDLIWANCQNHESTALDLSKVLESISAFMETREIIFFSSKILAKSPVTVKSQEVEMMLGMGKRTGIDSEEFKTNQRQIVKFFWNYLFDPQAVNYFDISLATTSIASLAELIKVNGAECIREYFGYLVDKIRGAENQSFFCILIILRFLKMYSGSEDLSEEALLNELQTKYNMLDLLIEDLATYITKVKACISDTSEFSANDVGKRVFFDVYPHTEQIQYRVKLFKDFAQSTKALITQSQLERIWTEAMVNNPILQDHKIISQWLQTICDDFLLGRNTSMFRFDDLQNFFRQTVCNEANNYEKLTLEGYHCIQGFFLLINLKAAKLVILDDLVAKTLAGVELKQNEQNIIQNKKIDPDVIQVHAKVAPNDMDGIQVLWKIAIDCQEARVGTGVTSMLLQVHTNVDFGMDDQITSFEDQFIKSCMEIIKEQKQAINERSAETIQLLREQLQEVYKGVVLKSKIKAVLPMQEKRIIACLQYLKMLVLNSEKDGTNNLIPHQALQYGSLLGNITINNTYDKMNCNGFRNQFKVQMWSNATVYQLKQKICEQLSWRLDPTDNTWKVEMAPHPWTIRITKFNGQVMIKDDDNGKTLADLNFTANEVLSVCKKTSFAVSKVPLITAENKINERAKTVLTGIFYRYAVEHPDNPSLKILNFKELELFVQDATKQKQVTSGVNEIMTWAKEEQGRMNLEEYLAFYEDCLNSKADIVRQNLANMGYREDLKIMPPPGSPDGILQIRQTVQDMPRFKISQNNETFSQIVSLLDLQSKVSKEAQCMLKMICTNQKIFWDILKLNQRTEQDQGAFSWDMIFFEDIKMSMYSLDIIDSIIKTPAFENYSYESNLRANWVQRFLEQGGFEQILFQLKHALNLSQDSLLQQQDHYSESCNLAKKFMDQMLRLMKTFIYAVIIADSKPAEQDNLLLLKRQSSKIQEQTEEQKAKEEQDNRKKASQKADEESFGTSAPRSTIGGPTVPWVGARNPPVYGPQPPAGMGNSIGVGTEDDELERALKESEDPRNQVVPGTYVPDNQTTQQTDNTSDDEFEQSPRFKQIVDQIRNANLSSDLIQKIDFGDIQHKLLDTLVIFLARKSNQSQEEGNIISSALKLFSASIVQKPELVQDFFAWSHAERPGAETQILNASDFILNGIYSPKSLLVRTQFKECIELICEKVTSVPAGGKNPLIYILKILMNHFPSIDSPINTRYCSEYFTLFGALINQYQEVLVKSQSSNAIETQTQDSEQISILDLLKESFNRMRDHESTERDSDSQPDTTLIGLLILTKELLGIYILKTDYDELIAFSKKNHLLHEFFYENLYYMPQRTTNVQNKCKTDKSRTNAYKLLYKIMKAFKPKEMAEFLEDYLWPMIEGLPRPTSWRHQPSMKQRSAVHKQAGIRNLGNICYMISMLQQFYMVPQFRYQLLQAVDTNPEDIKTYKDRKVDDSLLRQFQRLFGFLELSERAEVDPFDFCFAYKDLTGEPTNVAVQCDSQEFLTFFFDRMENELRNTSQKYLFQDVFRGSYVEQKVCQSCKLTKNNITTNYTLSVQVENTKDLHQSLQKVINGEVIEDYGCDGCNQKVNLTKRSLLGQMPNILIVHLQRIVFCYETFGNKKVNSKFEFPKILEMSRFSFKDQMGGDPQGVKGETEKDTAELAKLLELQDEDYVYRLVGVNIHRGVADSGHYWSMINTKRGKEEPDAAQDKAQWLSSNASDWKKFDDETVSYYNLGDLERDSFGGDTSNLTEDEQYISSTAGGSWGKSAYMLIYEKQQKKPIREVDLSAAADNNEEEKIQLRGYREVVEQPRIPEWLLSMIQKDNTEFVIDRQVFSIQFFKLVMLVLKHIANDLSMNQHQYPYEYLQYFNKMHQVALKIGQKVMFDFLSHYHENSCLSSICDYMSTIFTFSDNWISFVRKADEPSVICDWIEKALLDDQCTYFFHLMFNCPDKSARLYCGKIISSTVNKAFRILEMCESKPEERDHPKVQKMRAALDSFMQLALDVIHTRECQKNWTKLEQFYIMLEDICTAGKPQTEYLLDKYGDRILVNLIDLMLQDKSPKAKLETESRVEMGGSVTKAAFGPLTNIVSHLIMCMSTETTKFDDPDVKTFKLFDAYLDKTKPPSRVTQQIQLSSEALEYFTNADYIQLMMSNGEQEAQKVGEAFAHICFKNKKLTKDICRAALKAINISDYSRITGYLKVVQSQLANCDGLLNKRLEWIFGFPFLNTGLQQGEVHKIGLDSLHHNIKGEVYTFKSMLTYEPENMNSLLHLLWRYQGRMEDFTMTCLNCLADIVTHSEQAMEFFSNLPGITYQYARYSDWINPFLTSQLNKVSGSQAVYSAVSKEDIIKVMSKFEIYDNFIKIKDTNAAAKQINDEEQKQAESSTTTITTTTATESDVNAKFTIKTLTSTPLPVIICRCKDENYLNVVEQDGVMLSLSFLKGDYVMSRPTGYTNFAISTAFLASGGGSQNQQVPPLANPIASSTSSNKSAKAMLEELEAQKNGGVSVTGNNSPGYAGSGSAPLRVKSVPSGSSGASPATSANAGASPQDGPAQPKIIVDGNEEWDAIRVDTHDPQSVADYTNANQEPPRKEEECMAADAEEVKQGQQCLNESFDNWTGDQMHTCDDLVYKLTLSNTTEQPILYKIVFKAPAEGEVSQLNYPINGIKGSLAANEMSNIAALLTRHVQPADQAENGGKYELEKVQPILTWKPDVEKIARQQPNNNRNAAADNQQSGGGAISSGTAIQPQSDFQNLEAIKQDDYFGTGGSAMGPVSDEKNCGACTFLNPMSATSCSCCGTPF